jgi:hypothetical protein
MQVLDNGDALTFTQPNGHGPKATDTWTFSANGIELVSHASLSGLLASRCLGAVTVADVCGVAENPDMVHVLGHELCFVESTPWPRTQGGGDAR